MVTPPSTAVLTLPEVVGSIPSLLSRDYDGVRNGRVRDLRTGAEYEPGSRVQACVTAPSGDCVVDI